MTDTLTVPVETDKPTSNTFHWTCCEGDHFVALCGLDVSDGQYVPVKVDPVCIVCDDLEHTDTCPKYGTCRYPRERA